jgi:putative DNA methylase
MSDCPIKSPRKLIEVALPLDAINAACAYEKMPGIGAHPRGIHLWWARRPLAAARAVIFAQLVNDPAGLWDAENPGKRPNKQQRGAFTKRRQELFNIVEDLVKWENTTNEEVLERARAEIRRSWREVCELNKDHPQAAELFNPEKPPALHDPFAGGGAIPLEAQRLGLESFASDLNPVPVLINKAMIEIPPKFAAKPPVNPSTHAKIGGGSGSWPGVSGLVEDVRHYGALMRAEAEKRIGHLYPPVEVTTEMAQERPDLKPLVGQKLAVIAWIWARTVKSPNPAFSHVDVPLAASFILANKEGKQAYVEPIVEGDSYRFTVKVGTPPKEAAGGTTAGKRKAFRCLMSNTPIDYDFIREEGKSGRMGQKLMAIVAEGARGRIYLTPTSEAEEVAAQAKPSWKPEMELPDNPRDFKTPNYGLTTYGDLFTPRQMVALTTFSDLVWEVREQIFRDALAAGLSDDQSGFDVGGTGAQAYAGAVSVYLAFAVNRCADFNNSVTRWVPGNQKVMNLFGKQAIAMTWDYPEAAILADTVGGFSPALDYIADCIELVPCNGSGSALQADAQNQKISAFKSVSTDPPYYDNIGYADLSDFFYTWLRRSLRPVLPSLFSTISVPKAEELVATPYRHGGKEEAESFFLNGMTDAMRGLATQAHPHAPITIYYAFKQSETTDNETTSTGWVAFLEAVNRAGLQLTGTWPLRSEQEFRMISMGNNALASSIVLVCRKRPADAPSISRRDFIRELNGVLPEALDEMTKGSGDERSPVAPVDLSQAIIGPGMAVFSKYAAVLEADGSPMSVRTALQLINRFLAEDDFDADSQFCLHWFEQHGWMEGLFGEADVLARSKSTSVDAMKDAGVLKSGSGKVRLLKWAEYPTDWDPRTDKRTPVWEALHQLIRALKSTEGEGGAGAMLAALGGKAEPVRQLAYRLYTLCERQGRAEDARAYNELITSWTGIETAAASAPAQKSQGQTEFEY